MPHHCRCRCCPPQSRFQAASPRYRSPQRPQLPPKPPQPRAQAPQPGQRAQLQTPALAQQQQLRAGVLPLSWGQRLARQQPQQAQQRRPAWQPC